MADSVRAETAPVEVAPSPPLPEGVGIASWQIDVPSDSLISTPELSQMVGLPPGVPVDIATIRRCFFSGERGRVRNLVFEALQRGETVFETMAHMRRPDGTARDILLRGQLHLGAQGEPRRVTGVAIDLTNHIAADVERKRLAAALAEREGDMRALLDAASLAIFDYDHVTQQLRQSPALNELYGYPPDHELTLEEIQARYHPDEAQALQTGFDDAANDATLHHFDINVKLLMPDGCVRWINGRGEYIRDEQGRALRSRGTAMDVTAHRELERNRELLVNELDHRVKNLLAVVEAIARQTYRGEVSLSEARDTHLGRLGALRRAHDHIFAGQWQEAPIREVVEAALAPYRAGNTRWAIGGPDLFLSSKQALSLTLALHEMATNAVKYGALSTAMGRVALSWQIDATLGSFTLLWQESGGPHVTAPIQRGFGTRLVESALSDDFGGRVDFVYAPEGVAMTVTAPLDGLAAR